MKVSEVFFQSIFIWVASFIPLIYLIWTRNYISPRWWAPATGWMAVGIRCFSPICWQVEMTQDRHDMNIPGSSNIVYIKCMCLFHQKTYTVQKANILHIWMIQVCYYMYVWLVYIIIYMPSFPYWLTNHSSRIRNRPNESNDRRWWGHSNRTMKSTWGWHEITKQEGSIVIMIIVYN